MALRAKVIGLDKVTKKLRDLPAVNRKGVARAITLSALAVQGTAQRSIQRGTRTGRLYSRGSQPPHRASAPGEPPKSDTQTLAGSIFAEFDVDGLGADIGTDLNYGAWLEDGTTNIQPRPWLQPAFDATKEKNRERIRNAVAEAMRSQSRR